jgi:hypothetical protein
MRRLAVIVACCGVFQLLTPAPAQAWYEWIDQLSGPGPFNGIDLQYRVACAQASNVAPAPAGTMPTNKPEEIRALNTFRGAAKAGAAIAGAGCLFEPQKSPVAWLNMKVARLWSKDNHLTYGKTATADRTVNLWEFEPSFAVFVDEARFMQLAVGMGWMRFSGDAFDSFWRHYWKPVELTVTPGARLARGNGLRAFSFTMGVKIIPEGFDATDFGAVRGTFHTEQDILTTVSATIDFSRF